MHTRSSKHCLKYRKSKRREISNMSGLTINCATKNVDHSYKKKELNRRRGLNSVTGCITCSVTRNQLRPGNTCAFLMVTKCLPCTQTCKGKEKPLLDKRDLSSVVSIPATDYRTHRLRVCFSNKEDKS